MLKIRHPKKGASDVEYSTFDGGQYRIENRIESFCTPIYQMSSLLPFLNSQVLLKYID